MTAAPDNLPLDLHLCFAMYSTNIAINRLYKPLLDGLGITYPQYLVLSVLAEKGSQSVSAIAERLSLESSTITPLVKRLETAGLLQRQRNPADERQVIVSLTAKGTAMRKDASCLTATLLEQSGMPVDEIIRLNAEVTALRDTLTKNDLP
ncbi:MarR family winged helix-turn-helix transcriptional regulator [Novosphingobium terrae]|uniref:MarR family winged helix-turn-helix transcriptional regulator n=1 Tax=Novosphingobium terrae TaxID=2726189 RepID=UPI00197E5FF4|nr:MarR family transcriptional regulator [Novosphingobium terrae]